MGLETVTYVGDLVTTNPAAGDQKSLGDDHLRNIKTALRNTFPNGDRAQYFSRAVSKTANYSILSTDMEKLFVADATGGAFNLTLPTLTSSNDGWFVTVVKSDASANAVTVVGTINGETNIAISARYQAATFMWTGTAWMMLPYIRMVAGVPTFASGAFTGNVTVGGTLDVTGASTVAALTASGVVTQNATSHEKLPVGTTAQRSGTTQGSFRFNSDLIVPEWYSGTAWVQAQLAAPPPASYKNLVITVASNTTVTVSADWVVVTDGTLFKLVPVSSTVNLGTTGVDALDTGVIAIDQWYHLWVITKADGTTKVIASLRSTNDATFLSNLAAIAGGAYTFYARIGAVQTIHASATLYGTKQVGDLANYIVGLAQTSALPQLDTSGTGSVTVPTWVAAPVARFVPTTASHILLSAGTNNALMVAPNNSYGRYDSGTNPPPIAMSGIGGRNISSMMLESTNIYQANNGGASLVLACMGWKDKL